MSRTSPLEECWRTAFDLTQGIGVCFDYDLFDAIHEQLLAMWLGLDEED